MQKVITTEKELKQLARSTKVDTQVYVNKNLLVSLESGNPPTKPLTEFQDKTRYETVEDRHRDIFLSPAQAPIKVSLLKDEDEVVIVSGNHRKKLLQETVPGGRFESSANAIGEVIPIVVAPPVVNKTILQVLISEANLRGKKRLIADYQENSKFADEYGVKVYLPVSKAFTAGMNKAIQEIRRDKRAQDIKPETIFGGQNAIKNIKTRLAAMFNNGMIGTEIWGRDVYELKKDPAVNEKYAYARKVLNRPTNKDLEYVAEKSYHLTKSVYQVFVNLLVNPISRFRKPTPTLLYWLMANHFGSKDYALKFEKRKWVKYVFDINTMNQKILEELACGGITGVKARGLDGKTSSMTSVELQIKNVINGDVDYVPSKFRITQRGRVRANG